MDDFNQADVDFVNEMIAHHMAAIKMVTDSEGKLKNREIELWAIDIMTGQSSEIMRRMLWLRDRNISTDAKPMPNHG